MNMLQLALLILGILIILGVIINALRERRRDSLGATKWTPPGRSGSGGTGKGLPLGDQMDIFGSAAGEFDEFGVGRPRKVKEGEAVAPPAAKVPPQAAPTPASEPPAESATPEPAAASRSRKTPTMAGEPEAPPVAPSAPLPPLSSGLLRTPSAGKASQKPAEKAAEASPDAPSVAPSAPTPAPACVVVLFVAERQGQPLPGARIHAALKGQGLTPTPEKIYQRGSGDDVSFSIASLIKPGALDPAEAARFASPGLTLYLTVPGPRDPVAALEDLFITSDRLAGALDGDVFDQARQPLTAAARASLRQKVAAAAQAA